MMRHWSTPLFAALTLYYCFETVVPPTKTASAEIPSNLVNLNTAPVPLSMVAEPFLQPIVARKVDIFFYPPVYVMPDGSKTGSTVTFDAAQATTQVPFISEMAGVKVISYWSLFCPTATVCNFDMLNQILSYWHERHKKIILDIATWGLPFRWNENGRYIVKSATPDWVMDSVTTFTQTVSVLFNTMIGSPKITVPVPAYWDSHFMSYIQAFANRLRQFDGNPAIAQMLIPIGLLGEDNPSMPGVSSDNALNQKYIPNFTFLNYISYAKSVSEIYIKDFKKTQLVVDLGGIPTIYAHGDAAAKQAADDYIDFLVANHVMLAFDGWQTATSASLPHVDSGPYIDDPIARILFYLKLAKARGDQIGLEVMGPTHDSFHNPQSGLIALHAIAPDRIVMMGDSNAALYDQRNKTKTTYSFQLSNAGSDLSEAAEFAEQVLKLLGY